VITREALDRMAAELDVPPGVLCSTCGRLATTPAPDHFGHRVTRLRPASRALTSVAGRGKVLPAPRIEWLTVAEVANELGVAKMTVYRLVHGGELVGHRIGRSIRIQRTALDGYIGRVALTVTTEGAP
jgi:excisionase family DNA binding protein